MLAGITNHVTQWASDVKRLISDQVVDLEPHEYCVGAVFIIAIGHLLLKR